MVTIVEDFIPQGRRNRPGYKLVPRYVTIHDTANPGAGADARAHAKYLKGSAAASIPASWHFTVDDGLIVQHLPLNENGWHAGDGSTGTGNRASIGIEICENRDGIRLEAEKNAAWLTAKLLHDFSLEPAQVKQHNFWSGKNCPRVLRGRSGGWDSFLDEVRLQLQPLPQHPSGTPLLGMPGAAVQQAREWARRRKADALFIEIATFYWEYGLLTGIRPEVLYAQSAKETAFGRFGGAVQQRQNNWAGIKVRSPKGDSADDFETFATPREGVRAHFNHMCAYVGLEPAGVPHGRYWIVLAQPWAGQIRFVEELGGRWAVGTDYGTSIVRDYLDGLLETPAPPDVEPPPVEMPGPPEPPQVPPPVLPEIPEPLPEPQPEPLPEPLPEPDQPDPPGPEGFLAALLKRLLVLIHEFLKKLGFIA